MAGIDARIVERARRSVAVMSRYAKVKGGYVFGSHVNGMPDADSDIDVAVFLEGVEDWDLSRQVHVVCDVQKEAGDDIEIHCFHAESLTYAEPASFAAYVLKHGVCIYSPTTTS